MAYTIVAKPTATWTKTNTLFNYLLTEAGNIFADEEGNNIVLESYDITVSITWDKGTKSTATFTKVVKPV
jgi:hypothetical protein